MKDGSSKKREKKKMTRKEYAVCHYVELRKNKSSVEEIAKACHVTTAFIYSYVIPEVIKRTGIAKDDLLYFPKTKQPVYMTKPGRKPKVVTDVAGTTESANVASEEVADAEFTADVTPTCDKVVEEATNVQKSTCVDSNPTSNDNEAGDESTKEVVLNPILKKILENVNAVRHIVQGMC